MTYEELQEKMNPHLVVVDMSQARKGTMDDKNTLTTRDLKEIYFAMYYAAHLAHGTDGHNRLLIIDKLARAAGFTLGDHQLRYDGGQTGGTPIDLIAGIAWPSLTLPEK